MAQSQLPNSVLAQIWTLSDHNKDGRLSVEEFCVAMHLIDSVKVLVFFIHFVAFQPLVLGNALSVVSVNSLVTCIVLSLLSGRLFTSENSPA